MLTFRGDSMFEMKPIVRSLELALGGVAMTAMFAPPALAQQQQAPVVQERVEVTGSSLRRVDAETALPVTIIRTEDLAKQGVTSVEQAVARIAAGQAGQTAVNISGSVGAVTGGKSEANLRGLGSNKTLVLLNGRRLANHAYVGVEGSTDLNAIPLAAIDRIEVLRDGASSLYGSDAVGGVINFILRREYSGLEVAYENQTPQKDGGKVNRATLTGGYGSLDKQRFNVFGSLDYRKQDVLLAAQRDFSKTGIIDGQVTAGTSGTSFPGSLDGFSPSLAAGCAPPSSIPNEAGTACRYDFSREVDDIPKSEQLTGLIRGSFQLTPDNLISAEYLRAKNKVTDQVAPDPRTGDLMPLNHPDWPIDPATGLPRPTTIADVGNGQPGGLLRWRSVPMGKRTTETQETNERLLGELQGSAAGWDYRGAIGKNKFKSEDFARKGFGQGSVIQQDLLNGLINPFGPQSAADQAALDAAQVNQKYLTGRGDVSFIDGRVAKDLATTSAGTLSFALGAEFRKEKYSNEPEPITGEVPSLGVDPLSGVSGERKVWAGFFEFGIPIVKSFDATLSGRYDHYSDFGSTFNPKVALRYQPAQQVLLRASYNTGFRAPTLYDIYSPANLTFTANPYDDPVLCPNGTAIPPADPGVVCGQQTLRRLGGPVSRGQPINALKPEKSQTVTFGMVFEPTNSITMGLDFWWLMLKHQLTNLPEQAVFSNLAKYGNRITRCSQITAAERDAVNNNTGACIPTTYDAIAWIDVPTQNLGNISTYGVDVTFASHFPTGEYGRLGINLDGTYVTKYDYQREDGGEYIHNVGVFQDAAPVLRWQHSLSFSWSTGPWATTVTNLYRSGYIDQFTNADGSIHEVGSYSIFDFTLAWSGVKNLTLLAGVHNIFDTNPPSTNQTLTFQRGYDPRFADPRGRTWLFRAAYKFL
jgi:iron complex outermembrane receptor protein